MRRLSKAREIENIKKSSIHQNDIISVKTASNGAYFLIFSILVLRIFPYSESFHFKPYLPTLFTRRMPRQGGHALSRA